MKILTFNLHCLENNWQQRFSHIAKEIAAINPDVIGLQELCTDQMIDSKTYLLQELQNNGYQVKSEAMRFSHLAWDKYREHLLIISKHSAEETLGADLPVSPMLRVYVGLKIAGITYINTHLEYSEAWREYRRKQIDFLSAKFEKIPSVIMGDFNASPTDNEQNSFKASSYSAFFPEATFPSIKPTISIDGMWISSKLQTQFLKTEARVVLNSTISETEDYPSDHVGVLLNLK